MQPRPQAQIPKSPSTPRPHPRVERVVIPRLSHTGYEPALAIASELALRHGCEVHIMAGPGDPTSASTVFHVSYPMIESLADALQPSDVIVLATTTGDHSTSFAQEITQAWSGPVMMVGPACSKDALPAGSVAVALDGSAFAERAIAYSCMLATSFDTGLTLVEVIPDHGEQVSDAAYIVDVSDRLRSQGVKASWAIVHDDEPARGLESFTAEHEISALVMATHGRGPLPRSASPSTCLAVLERATVPVVALRPPAAGLPAIDLAGDA